MPAQTANVNRPSKSVGMFEFPVAAGVRIYKGAMVCMSAAGFAIPAADTAGISEVAGVADEEVDNTLGAAGALKIRVISRRSFRLAATGITQAVVGLPALVKFDNEVDDASTNSIRAGVFIGFISTTEAWVLIDGLSAP